MECIFSFKNVFLGSVSLKERANWGDMDQNTEKKLRYFYGISSNFRVLGFFFVFLVLKDIPKRGAWSLAWAKSLTHGSRIHVHTYCLTHMHTQISFCFSVSLSYIHTLIHEVKRVFGCLKANIL